MFADDITFYQNSPTNLQSKLNAHLAAITSWLHDNKLTLNITKSKRIRSLWSLEEGTTKLSQFNDIALVANNDHLENVTKFKYLGVIINQHLTWHDHIEQLQSKIAKRLGVLKRIKHLIPVYARRIYVSTMVIPILEYASIVRGDKNNKVLMDSIQVLQNYQPSQFWIERLDAFFFNSSTSRSELDESVNQKINATVFFYS